MDTVRPACLTDGKADRRNFRVMSFNMAHGQGMDGRVDLERTAKVIKQSNADIICLQEVDQHFSDRSDFMDQAAVLGGWLDMDYSYGANLIEPPARPGMPDRKYGNALLSRFPVKFTENHPLILPSTLQEDPEPRGVLETILDLGGTYVSVLNTHLSLGERELEANIRQLLQQAETSMFSTIIAGDFNMKPTHPELCKISSKFHDAFSQIETGSSFTFPANYSDENSGIYSKASSRIDYIFTDDQSLLQHAEVLNTPAADHLPIIADLQLQISPAKHQPIAYA